MTIGTVLHIEGSDVEVDTAKAHCRVFNLVTVDVCSRGSADGDGMQPTPVVRQGKTTGASFTRRPKNMIANCTSMTVLCVRIGGLLWKRPKSLKHKSFPDKTFVWYQVIEKRCAPDKDAFIAKKVGNQCYRKVRLVS